ncbi:MAG: chromosomal replication initiator protein DnaA [Oscillospiraceae bacterium]|jgi:chromosomal replication initiator protein|nr:chromosomal replication initiator protein DnaA [Oscillospiraceae bacterium]
MDSFMGDIWPMVQKALKESVSEITYSVWLSDLHVQEFDEDHAVLYTSAFKKQLIEKKFAEQLDAAFARVLGFSIRVSIIADPAEATPSKPAKTAAPPMVLQTFDSFVVGDSNKFAHAAAVAVAGRPGEVYNPLFIWGHSGLGKTHLMQAILHEIRIKRPDVRMISTTGEAFANELISHIYAKNMEAFHNKFRGVDVLLVDDVQFIGGKESTQEEFFHTFNEITNSGGQIALVSDRPPKEIATLDERLRTRFEMGLIADIAPPDLETRTAIVQRKAREIGVDFPPEICTFIAEKLHANVRQLEGAARKLHAHLVLSGRELTRQTAELAIRDVLEESAPPGVTVERIIEEIARAYGGSPEMIRGKKRDARTVLMRQAAIYCARQATPLSMQEIGKEFGGRDHSTVLHSLKTCDYEMKNNAQLRAVVNDVLKNIRE